jgi:hypothetical protein
VLGVIKELLVHRVLLVLKELEEIKEIKVQLQL